MAERGELRLPHVKILYRYIAREYIFAFIALLGLCILLMGLNVFFAEFDEIVENRPATMDVARYITYSLPGEIIELMPLIALLAVLFGIGILSKNHEVLAMHACGVSYTILGLPVLFCAVVLSILAFFFAETVLPYCEKERAIVDARIKNKELEEVEKNQYEPTREWIYLTDGFNRRTMTMERPTIINMGKAGDRISWKLSAREGKLVTKGETEDIWRFKDAITWRYAADGRPIGSAKVSPTRVAKLSKHLDKILGPQEDPSQMGFIDLRAHIKILKDTGENTSQYQTDLQKKLAFPFSTLILTLIGYTIAVRAHVRPMVVGFSYGLAAGILYYLMDALFSNFGHKGFIPPVMAGWIPNLAFLGFAIYRIRYMNQVRD